jgi:hypothetical protein
MYYHLMPGREFILLIDLQIMMSIFSRKHLSPRQSRWMLFLDQFLMKVEYISGETNVIADLLSRIPECSGYVGESLGESVNIDVSDQDFESLAFPLLIAISSTIRREKILL